MGIRYRHLDEITRTYMVAEFERDAADRSLYLSDRLTAEGVRLWPQLLSRALESANDVWLAGQLRGLRLLKSHEQKRKRKGIGFTMARLPYTAADTLAEMEFNCLYIRGLCARAIAEGMPFVIVERGKWVEEPRPASEERIGSHVPPAELLESLRQSKSLKPSMGILGGPNSGITVFLPDVGIRPITAA